MSEREVAGALGNRVPHHPGNRCYGLVTLNDPDPEAEHGGKG